MEAQNRAAGCLAGLLIGDSLGGLVEFQTREEILRSHPKGVRELDDGGRWNTIAGQPTDDGELALALSASIIASGGYDSQHAKEAYVDWFNSEPFDCGNTISHGLTGRPNHESQSNGAMMRSAPLAIFAAGQSSSSFGIASDDAKIMHPNPVTVTANQFYVELIARLIREGEPENRSNLAQDVLADLARDYPARETTQEVEETVKAAIDHKPEDYDSSHIGWVLVALQNALWQWHHTSDFEEALVDTISEGGDTDTNAAICGALLGATYGLKGIPERWLNVLRNCRPGPDSRMPRPKPYWPNNFEDLAIQLLKTGASIG